ncbi:hypothetical protein [Novosphingobium sp. UBA1939]|uniref:hypothetical protein n=1 Tax=Novosphingobium sp. UBA1939 TaxID=1946982 RepID=UPI0025F20B48|nr:hypothetical protein [Novosphingobium sp. UBA1939]
MRKADALLAALILPVSTLAAGAHAATADAAFVGHYYLSGVMETGSELLLRPDGTFAWYISYGAVDQSAEGTWLRDGDAVVLTASQPDRSAPLFALAGVDAWDADAESRLLGRQHDDATAAWEERCGSAAEAVTAVVAPLVDDAPATAPVEASPPMADPAPAPTRLPGCAPSDAPAEPADATTMAPDRWQGGIAIAVFAEQNGERMGVSRVTATLTYADGAVAKAATRRGWAFLPRKAGSRAIRLDLSAGFAEGRAASLPLPTTEQGVIRIALDARQVIPPAFTTLRLRIDGKALLPEAFGRGRYTRPSE